MNSRCVAAAFAVYFAIVFSADAYDWNDSLDGYVTRCFETKNVRVHCENLSDDPKGGGEVAELGIEAVDRSKRRFSYGYLKGIESPLCREHLQKIRKVMNRANQVCVTGWDESLIEGVMLAHWSSLETRNGRVSW